MADTLDHFFSMLGQTILAGVTILMRISTGLAAGGLALFLTHWIPWGFDWLNPSHQELFIQHWNGGTIDQVFLFSGLLAFILAAAPGWFLPPLLFRMSSSFFTRLTRRLRLARQLQAGGQPSSVRQAASTRTATPWISKDKNPRPEDGSKGGVTGNADDTAPVSGTTADPLSSDNPVVEMDVKKGPKGNTDKTPPPGTLPAEPASADPLPPEPMPTEQGLPDPDAAEESNSFTPDDGTLDDKKVANRLLTAIGPIMDRSSATSAAIPDQVVPDDQAAPDVQNKGDMAACCVRFLAVAGYQPLLVEPANPGRISMFGLDDQSILAFCLLPDRASAGEGPYQNAITAARRVPPILFRALRNDHILPEAGEVWEDVPELRVQVYVIGFPGSSPPPQLTGSADLTYLSLPSPLPGPDSGIEDWAAWCPIPIPESYRTIPDHVLHRFLESTFKNG